MKTAHASQPRLTSVTMFAVAMLLIGSMGLREYAHFLDHFHHLDEHPGTVTTDFDHQARFHSVTGAEPVFEPPCWHEQVAPIPLPQRQSAPSSRPHILPPTRAPPAFV